MCPQISRIVAATARNAKTAAMQQHTSSHNEWATELVTRCMSMLAFIDAVNWWVVYLQ